MKSILERLHAERYVNVYVILLIDMSASLAASVLSLAGLSLLFPQSAPYTLGFLAEWLLSGAAGIGLCFYIGRLYKRWSKVDPWLKAYDKMCDEVMDNPNPSQL